MEISVNSEYFRKKYDGTQRDDYAAAVLLYNAGFRHIDCTAAFASEEGNLEKAKTLRAKLDALGMDVDQAHAPFNRYKKEDPALFQQKLFRSFETAAVLGARYIVIHADEYRVPEGGVYRSEDAVAFAYEYFAPLVEFAKKKNLGVAVENLFEENPKAPSRCCSRIEELIAVLEKFNDPAVRCCWDFGHGAVAFGAGWFEKMKLVAPWLAATHVHDNYLNSDSHLPIFLGKMDWTPVVPFLREIGYRGTFTYEMVYGKIPDELLPSYAALSYRTAEYFVNGKRP